MSYANFFRPSSLVFLSPTLLICHLCLFLASLFHSLSFIYTYACFIYLFFYLYVVLIICLCNSLSLSLSLCLSSHLSACLCLFVCLPCCLLGTWGLKKIEKVNHVGQGQLFLLQKFSKLACIIFTALQGESKMWDFSRPAGRGYMIWGSMLSWGSEVILSWRSNPWANFQQ